MSKESLLINLLQNYTKEMHLNYVHASKDFKIVPLFSQKWTKNTESIPYCVSTYLLDAYYCLPERPDIAFLFFWECINNNYNTILFSQSLRYSDKKGKEEFCKIIFREFEKSYTCDRNCYSIKSLFQKILESSPDKVWHFLASYILKGYVIEDSYPDKTNYLTSSYISFKTNYKKEYNIIIKSYGEKFKKLYTPRIENDSIKLSSSDGEISRKIIHSLGMSLKKLVINGVCEITDVKGNKDILNLSEKDKIQFLMDNILYAVRCNSFHGNVASRLNSVYANKDSYLTSKFLCILSYYLINVALIAEGKMDECDIICSVNLLEKNNL